MKNIELLEHQIALQRVRDAGIEMEIDAAYAVAYNIHNMKQALDPYIESRKTIEQKHMREDGEIDTIALSSDDDLNKLNDIEVECDIRKVPLDTLPKTIGVDIMTALYFMIK